MSDWAKRNNVRPTREEIQEHFANEAKQYPQFYETDEGAKRAKFAMGWSIATTVEWATAKALHEKYGGRIAVSSFGGWVSIEGRNALLKEYAAAGKIRFHDPEIEKLFWGGVDNPAVLDVTVSDPKRISSHFARPPWEGWGPGQPSCSSGKTNRSKLLTKNRLTMARTGAATRAESEWTV